MGKDRGANMNRLCGEGHPWLRPDESRAHESESPTLRGSSLLALKTTHTTGEARIRIAELERASEVGGNGDDNRDLCFAMAGWAGNQI